VLGLSAEVGTLEPGKLADVVALAGNPLEELASLYRVVAVVKEGRLVVGNGGGDESD